MGYVPNRLNEFDTYTYNIRLHMINPQDVREFEKNIDLNRAILIADNTTESRYNISTLETVSKTGYYPLRNQILGSITMQIVEPNGTTFLSHIVESARELGIQNHVQALYLLTIEFIGRRPDGTPDRHPDYYFPIFIRSIRFSINNGGTTYDIDAIEHSNMGYQYLNQVIKEQLTIEAATVGEFVRKFEEKINLNEVRVQELDPYDIYPDIYSIEFEGEAKTWLDWRFEELTDVMRTLGINRVDNERLQIPINNGSMISDIIGMVLSLTREYKQIPTYGSGSYRENGPSSVSTATLDRFPVFFKVLTYVDFMNYDPIRGDYQKHIGYTVLPYIAPDLIVDSVSYHRGITDVKVQRGRVKELLDAGLLRKRYDYLYTGNNTEILNFEMKFDRLFYILTPVGGGKTGNPNDFSSIAGKDSVSSAARLKDIARASNEIARIRRQETDLQNRSSSLRRQSGDSVNGESDILIGESNVIENSLQELRGQLDTARQNLRTQRYLYESENERDAESSLKAEDIAHPVRFENDVINNADHAGPESDLDGGQFLFGGVRANLENPADLLNVELHIRGDPYWLGRRKTFLSNTTDVLQLREQRFLSRTNTNPKLQHQRYLSGTNTEAEEYVDYTLGGNLIYVKSNLPIPDEDESGLRIPRPDYQITALYLVRNVISRFQGGTFEQYLECAMDLGTNAPTVIDELDDGDSEKIQDNTGNTDTNDGIDPAQNQENSILSLRRSPIQGFTQ